MRREPRQAVPQDGVGRGGLPGGCPQHEGLDPSPPGPQGPRPGTTGTAEDWQGLGFLSFPHLQPFGEADSDPDWVAGALVSAAFSATPTPVRDSVGASGNPNFCLGSAWVFSPCPGPVLPPTCQLHAGGVGVCGAGLWVSWLQGASLYSSPGWFWPPRVHFGVCTRIVEDTASESSPMDA